MDNTLCKVFFGGVEGFSHIVLEHPACSLVQGGKSRLPMVLVAAGLEGGQKERSNWHRL